jgi:hypothetical protein
MKENTKIKSMNLEAALLFLCHKQGQQFTPDAIKEQTLIDVYRNGPAFPPTTFSVKCSHASTGRMLRRAEQNRTIYQGLILRRGSVRNTTDTDDLATFYLDEITPNDPEYTVEE